MSEEFVWSEARERISTLFAGHLPYDEDDERTILQAWQRNPRRIEKEAERLSARQASGDVSFPWRVLAKIAKDIHSPIDESATARVDRERESATRRFDGWLRNAGLHCDRIEDVLDEAFGDQGRLALWKDDPDVVAHVRERWQELRPLGVEREREAEGRMASYRAQQAAAVVEVPPDPGVAR